MDKTGNPTTRGYAQSEPITLAVEIEPGDCFDEVIESLRAEPVVFRGALVEADGLTWWERKIRDLEAKSES